MATQVESGTLVPTRSKRIAAATPQPQRAPARPGSDEVVRLTNRTVLLTFVTAAASIAALTSLPSLLAPSTRPVLRLVAAIVVLGAVVAFVAVLRARALLRAARAAAADEGLAAAGPRP